METTATYSFMPGDAVLPGARHVHVELLDGRRCVFDRRKSNPDFEPAKHLEVNPDYDKARPVSATNELQVPVEGAPPMTLQLEALEAVMTHEHACALEDSGYRLSPSPRAAWLAQRQQEIEQSEQGQGANAEPGDSFGGDVSGSQPATPTMPPVIAPGDTPGEELDDEVG